MFSNCLTFDVQLPVASDGGYPQSHFVVITKNQIRFIITSYSINVCTRFELACKIPEIVTIVLCEQWGPSELNWVCLAVGTARLSAVFGGCG